MSKLWNAMTLGVAMAMSIATSRASAQESIWIEAEHLNGIEGYIWPMGKPEMRKASGKWALSGPGWAAEWAQGGESNFLSIACGVGEKDAVATKDIDIPVDGVYHVWVRYRDNRESSERFQIKLEQPGNAPIVRTYGEKAVVEEDNEMKLYWTWAFGWDEREASLKKGPAKLSLMAGGFAEPDCRQLDVIVLTTDAKYRPWIKDRPENHAWDYLATLKNNGFDGVDSLAKNPAPLGAAAKAPEAWRPRTFQDKGFLYLWNVDETASWAGEDPKRVLYPYNMRDANLKEAFEKKYGGQKDVPIFSDPRIVPTFQAVGPRLLQTDAPAKPIAEASARFMKWLDANPERFWATMMNYYPDTPLSPAAVTNFDKYRSRYVGSIAGEHTGYYYIKDEDMKAATANAKTRREIVEAFSAVNQQYNAQKYRTVLGKDLDKPFQDVISCQSCGMIQFAPLMYLWGARTVGFEAAGVTWALLPMRMAFLRGAARQNGGLTATYRSSNFGDSCTMFSETGTYSNVTNILDNYYSVFSGTGATWYKFDIWYQYMAGSSMFYHEQGFDEFWMPGGTTAAGRWEIQLSPKGKLVDRFLRITAAEPDRGVPYTPVGILVDYAHGWEPTSNWPGEWNHQPIPRERTPLTDHHQMMQEYFATAYYPILPRSQAPITALSEAYCPGVFGDIFDVTYAYPDVKKWTTIDTYPVVIAAGDIELTAPEGERLKQYVENGGTLLVTDSQFTGPGAAALKLPATDANLGEADGFQWVGEKTAASSQRFRYHAISDATGKTIATSNDGKVICASYERGNGRLVYLSIPRGLGIDRTAVSIVPRLFAHLSRGLMPVEVKGDVEWSLNQSKDGWLVTLINPAGQNKPQQGISPTDYRENRQVTIVTSQPVKAAKDRLLPTDPISVDTKDGKQTVTLTVVAGGVRVIELK